MQHYYHLFIYLFFLLNVKKNILRHENFCPISGMIGGTFTVWLQVDILIIFAMNHHTLRTGDAE